MIAVEKAKELVLKNTVPLNETILINVADSYGFCLANDIYSPLNLPPFNQSNVDGYAVKFFEDNAYTWNVIHEVKAGDTFNYELKTGEACRIYTGAMVPAGADAVIMQENCLRENNILTCVKNLTITLGEHIRLEGEQIKKDALAVAKHTIINPAVISFLASLGTEKINVYKKPSITIIVTGNELQQLGEPLNLGNVYDSNSHTLKAVLHSMGILDVKIVFVKDDKALLKNEVQKIINTVDVLLLSGGISVGDYDFVNEILTELNTKTIFYKVAQKPGKPIFFGKNKNTLVFALPGNPASALTCFYQYVLPALQQMQRKTNLFLRKQNLAITKSITKSNVLALFLKALVIDDKVEPLTGQQSFIMKSFSESNAFIYLPAHVTHVWVDTEVEVHFLPEA